jgi:hypothetical protein
MKYIGTKILENAIPMTKKEYNDYRKWEMPNDEDPKEPGYLVEYEENPNNPPNHHNHIGYISWSPKEIFEKTYKPMMNMSFGNAIDALKLGQLISRNGWNEKGLCVMKQIPAEISLDIIPNMQSLQQSLKDKLVADNNTIKYRNQMIIVNQDGTANSWTPSAEDVFADDWKVII